MKNNEKIKVIDRIYLNGEFIKPNGTESMDIINPSTKEMIGRVILGNEVDTQKAIAAAKEAFKTFSKTTLEERSDMLKRLYDAVISRADELTQACVEEYGAAVKAAAGRTQLTANSFLWAKEVMEEFEFTKYIGKAKVVLEPVGVIA